MSDEKETKLSQDDLKQVAGTPTTKELSPEDLNKVAGGAFDQFLKLGDTKGA
jgi:hypothetical protein